MTQVSIMPEVRDVLGLYLFQKDLKSGKIWLSYGHFTNCRLLDSSQCNPGCMGSIRASFEPKISKIGQDMAELWPI